MSYLVRKIERNKWTGSDKEGDAIRADVVATCIRPNKSELSVWYAENDQDLPQAKLAVLAATNKLAAVDIVVLTLDEVERAGLKVVESTPAVGPEALKPRHRDIAELNLDSLKIVASIVQAHIVGEKEQRISRQDCKAMLLSAIAEKLFSAEELNVDLSRHLGLSEPQKRCLTCGAVS